MNGIELIFLGTGGGRFVTFTQKRRTGGIRILSPMNIQIDPGPGAIVYSNMLKLNPMHVEVLFVSHCHPDHYCDSEIFIEAMTFGMTKKCGMLLAPKSVLRGNEVCGPCISNYHKTMLKKVYELNPGDEFQFKDLEIKITKAIHTDPDSVGIRIKSSWGDIGYTSDTEFFEGIEEWYKGVRCLILCVLRPRNSPWKGHLCSDDAIKILNKVNPELAIITDFGTKMLKMNPNFEANYIKDETGIPTIAAFDNMRFLMEKEIKVSSLSNKTSLSLTQFI
ncbi:MAG: MBL fold metallo-hydrolase [Candidatus Bathyarchaeia archaeon]